MATLHQTDPELAALFEDFAGHQVRADSGLDDRTRLMVQLASTIASRALTQFRLPAGEALDTGLAPTELQEIVYQAVPYVGMATVLEFVHATHDLLTDRGGLAVQKQIVGAERVDAMYAGVLTVLLPYNPHTLNGLAALDEIAPYRPEESR